MRSFVTAKPKAPLKRLMTRIDRAAAEIKKLIRNAAGVAAIARVTAVAVLMGLSLNACTGPGISMSEAPGRGIADDIDASFWHGSTSLAPGQSFPAQDEPIGAIP
jgi:hypothetical protein